jgi:hypothetical protein
MAETVEVRDRYTKNSWARKIGDGPWMEQDLTMWGGRAPMIFSNTVAWVIETTIISKKEAKLLGYSE